MPRLWKSVLASPRKLIGLGGRDYRTLAETLALLCYVRLGLTFSSLTRLQGRLLSADAVRVRAAGGERDPYKLAWRVQSVARLVPNATCLTQGLALQTMLHRRGVASELKLGVRRTGDNGLAAHAWVIVGGKVVLGGSARDLREFAPIAEFGAGPQ